VKAAAFDWRRAADVGEASSLLAARAPDAKLFAGGQSLGPMLNLRLVRPALLVDVSRIEALRRIDDEGEAWRIGAAVIHARIEDARGRLPGGEMLAEVAGGIAYRAVRNRGTIGGSLAHADPAADWPLALAALGATIVVRGPVGERRLPADGFMLAAFTTQLAADEVIEAVLIPKLSAKARWGYFKFCRKTGEFPDASASVVLDPARRLSRIFLGALPSAPQSLPSLARDIAERGADALADEAIDAAVAAATPALDSVERRMHAGALRRALRQVFAA
jgi:carbon-monoxide dehydrogenase medium subunit